MIHIPPHVLDAVPPRTKDTVPARSSRITGRYGMFNNCLADAITRIGKGGGALPEKNILRQLIDIINKQITNHMIWVMNGVTHGHCPMVGPVSGEGRIRAEQSAAVQNMKNDVSGSAESVPDDIQAAIKDASKKYSVDEKLIHAVVKAESDYNARSISKKGAMGLMQLMPETARELGVKNPFSVSENIMGGTRYLRQLLDRYEGDVNAALAAYNWGMGNVERNPGRLPEETKTYVTRVNRYREGVNV